MRSVSSFLDVTTAYFTDTIHNNYAEPCSHFFCVPNSTEQTSVSIWAMYRLNCKSIHSICWHSHPCLELTFFLYSILLCTITIYQCDLNPVFPSLYPAYKYVSTDFNHKIEIWICECPMVTLFLSIFHYFRKVFCVVRMNKFDMMALCCWAYTSNKEDHNKLGWVTDAIQQFWIYSDIISAVPVNKCHWFIHIVQVCRRLLTNLNIMYNTIWAACTSPYFGV